jgi:hypothetical protein
LEKSAELREGGDACDLLFLCMARWQLGEKDAARTCYEQGVAWINKNPSGDAKLNGFRDEAAALLGVRDAATQPASVKNTTTTAPSN